MRSFIRVGLCLALIGLLAVPPVAAKQVPSGPTLVVANPSAGDRLTVGSLMMEGVAFDPLATQGNGVDRVSVFLDDRDKGGQFLGDAKLGAPNFAPSETAQFANAGWVLTTPALAGTGDSHQLFVYARSAVTDDEAIVQIPVIIGAASTGTAGGGETVAVPASETTMPPDTAAPAE